jgi:hypothetical protein
MRLIRIAALGVLASLAVGALAASSASAVTLPEFGKCLPVAAGSTGVYAGPNCVNRATTRPGKYEWTTVSSSEALEFAGLGGETKLATTGHPTITCNDSTFIGHYTGGKTALVTVTLQQCQNPLHQVCQSGTTAGSIEALPLEGELGFVKLEETKAVVGLDLKPQAPLTEIAVYSCGGSVESARIEGSVIAKAKPIDKMTRESNLVFAATFGHQVPESFEGGPTDTLSTTYTSGITTTTAPSTLRVKSEGGTSTAPGVEIKALEK